MLEFVFVIAMALMLGVSLRLSEYNFIHPSVLFCSSWLVSASGFLLLFQYWQVSLSLNAFLLLTAGNALFVLGCFVADNFSRRRVVSEEQPPLLESIKLSNVGRGVFCLLLIVSFVYCYCHQFSLANAINPSLQPQQVFDVLKYAREATIHGGYSNSTLFVNILRLCFVASFIVFYDCCTGVIRREKVQSLLLSVGFLMLPLLTGTRSACFGIIGGYAVILGFTNLARLRENKKRVAQTVLIVCIAAFVLLVLTNALFGRSGATGLIDLLAYTMKYLSSSIAGFSYFIENMASFPVCGFGANTFQSITLTLYNAGLSESPPVDAIKQFVQMPNLSTNVYTEYYPYIYDFGYAGILISFINGLIYGFIFRLTRTKCSYIALLVYAVLIMPLLMMFFEEQFWSILNTNLMRVCIVVCIYAAYCLIKKHRSPYETKRFRK